MDGVDSDHTSTPQSQVLVLGATNRVEALDSALLRPGRFGDRINIPLPTVEDRLDILSVLTRNMPLAQDVSINRLSQYSLTHNFPGAKLRGLCTEAAVFALRDHVSSFEKNETGGDEKHSNEMMNNQIKIEVRWKHFEAALNVVRQPSFAPYSF
mmetsp:Transcript_15164/g.18758  ORF Transcript_15164/g.18758 Transcript_15164/m.18758 type:complete len:154 (-) Transcript_15164:473-934(-)